MNKIVLFLLVTIGMIMLFQDCKKSGGETVTPKKSYTLTVSLAEGINGSPGTGTYTYNQGDTVTYDYSLKNGYANLTVTRNNSQLSASGTFTISGDVRLTASHSFLLQNIVQVRTGSQFRDRADIIWLLDLLVDYGIYGIELTVKQDEDDEFSSGYAFYNSSIAPVAAGYENFDALQITIFEARKRGLKVFAWLPQFHDKAAVERNAGWQMKALVNGDVVAYTGKNPQHPEYFVNPTDESVKDYQLSIIAEVAANYDIDGLFIDWVRFDDWNMDMNDSTRQAYQNAAGIDPANIDFTTDNADRQAWNRWRQAVIADYIGKAKAKVAEIKPGLPMGVHILPPEFSEVAQDPGQFGASIDYVSPLAYWDDWGYATSWTWETMLLQTVGLVDETKIIPDLDTDWSNDDAAAVVNNIKNIYPRIQKVLWFKYANWTRRSLSKIQSLNQE